MKAITIITLTLATLVSSNVFAGVAHNVAHNQHNRIAQGVANGSLTKAETHTLVSQQKGIAAAMKAAGVDGRVTPREANLIRGLQNNANHNIYNLKHN